MKREYEDMQEGFKQNQRVNNDYKIADLNLSELGRKSITMAEHEMPGLMMLRKEYKDIQPLSGARITGSTEAQMAIEWSNDKMQSYGLKTRLHEIQVPHWERGTKEVFYFKSSNGTHIKLRGLALGGSVGTNGMLRGKLIEFESLEALKSAKPSLVKDKIVFINQAMDAKQIQTFKAYGGCYPLRGNSASVAAEKGAVGTIIRSLLLTVS